jgi:hypothetical protein
MADQPKQASFWHSLGKRTRFGLRTLLAVVTVLALALGWLVQRVERQRAAVEEIERRGSRVVYAHQAAHQKALLQAGALGPDSPEAPPPGPAWLRRWLSPHYFQRVERVSLHPERAESDADWPLGDLPAIKHLVVMGGRVSAPQLRSIGEAGSLEALYIIDADLDERGMVHLANLRRLKQIELHGGSFTATGFRRLCQIPNLEELFLVETKVQPAGFESLPLLRKLRHLDVSYVGLQDEHVDSIAKMPSLNHALLLYTAITAERIERLRREQPHITVEFTESEPTTGSSDE